MQPGFLVSLNDSIFLNSWNSATGIVLSVQLRFIDANGNPTLLNFSQTPNTNRTLNTSTFQLPAGLLTAVVVTNSGSTARGQTFVQVGLIWGTNISAASPNEVTSILIQNYVDIGPAWNATGQSSPLIDPRDGKGFIKSVSLPAPAAGADYATVTVPTNARWVLRAFQGKLTTSGVVANRSFAILFKDASSNILGGSVANNQIASLVGDYVAANGNGNGVNTVANNGWGMMPLSPIPLPSGYQVSFATNNKDTGDQWAAGFLQVEEWIDI